MDPEAIRRFARRDWAALRTAKQDYWIERLRAKGPGALLEVVESLRQSLRAVRPDWPTPAERELDLAHHLRLKRQLDAARNAFGTD